MTTAIVEIELTAPLPTITLPPDARGALILLRHAGRPCGLLRLDAQGVLNAQQLRAALRTQTIAPRTSVIAPAAPCSIVVCTHERPDELRRCLDGLLPLGAAGHEVIIIDNAPRTGRTAEVAAHYPFRYLVEGRVGLDHARNCGLRAASHPIVAFTDDDAVADIDWIDALVQPFADPAVGCVTGLVLPLELETEAQELFELYCCHRRQFEGQRYQAPQTPSSTAGVAGMGANMAIRRDLALGLGGFDPRLDGGTRTCSGGDTDMFARVLDSGHALVYTPDALVWHHHRRDDAALRHCIFGYGVGLYSFLSKRVWEQGDLQALITGGRWFIGPLVKAAARWARGERAVPLSLLLVEAGGALLGPLRFWEETRKNKQEHYERAYS